MRGEGEGLMSSRTWHRATAQVALCASDGAGSESSQQAPTTEELDFFFLLDTFYVGRDSEMLMFISYRLVLTLECTLNLLF